MVRPKQFEIDAAIDAAVTVFREHGYEGTSAQMLVAAMGIGRQSLYDTFGDKWGVYRAAVRRYGQQEVGAHRAALATGSRAIDGLRAMLARVVAQARQGCLGVSSIVEFGTDKSDIQEIRAAESTSLRNAIRTAILIGQAEGDIAATLDPDELATFFVASMSGIRVAARGGASADHVAAIADLSIRAIR
jgi:AcrR family transcriptional regulator